MDISDFLDKVRLWALEQSDILALVLVGSHARGCARADSDIDLVILTSAPAHHRSSDFFRQFGTVRMTRTEDWGRVTSIRVWYADSGLEAEFGLSAPDWIAWPLDPGTARVLSDGYKVLLDKQGLFSFSGNDLT